MQHTLRLPQFTHRPHDLHAGRFMVWQDVEMASGYDYTSDHTRWTIRKAGDYYNVVRLDLSNQVVETAAERYSKAGAAATYAAQLAYRQAQDDDVERLRTYLIAGDKPPDTDE